ncbi:hypothetical protein DY000_02057564 [Brassica cretica]|uniref:Peptidase C14 caspase domain-containing protein n=1 Tax=Brassica cretica TaxID=69181 RepID=A0ABQ7AF10_BRACR|nr:hypothetical protein DY000_02057564 [Brassica cretica]
MVQELRTGKAYGAFSDAIQTILAETRKEITNKEMVLRAREILKRQNFSQRPAKEQIGESYVNKPKSRIVTFLVSIVRSLLTTCGISSNDSQRGSGGGHDSFTRESKLEDGETVDMKTRYLPLDSYISLLKEQTGQTDIKCGKIRQTLVKVFGEDSSPHVMLSNSMKRNAHRGLLGMFIGKREVNTDGAGSELKSKHPNNGILLSGCQTDQRSEDVYVTRTGKAYGAFSDAIQTILSGTRQEITNKEMVLRAREILKKQKFGQRPGLYCHDRYVNIPFIC